MIATPLAPPADPRLNRPRLVAFVVSLAALVATTNQTLIVPLLPQLPELLDIGPATASWLVTATVISGAVAHPLFGRLGDQFGLRRMLIVALGALVLGSALCALTDNIVLLIAGRAIQGLANAAIPLGMSLVGALVEPKHRRAAVATVSAMLGVGGALGLPAAGVVSQFWGFHGLFVMAGVAGLLVIIALVVLVPPTSPQASGTRVDVVGAVLLSATTVGLLVALDRGTQWGWTSPAVLGSLAGVVALGSLFTVVQLHRTDPLVDLRLAAERSSLAVTVSALLLGMGMFVGFLGTVARMQTPPSNGYGYGMTVLETGLYLLPSGILSAVAASLSPRVANRIGSRNTSALGCILLLVGCLSVLVFADHGPAALVLTNVVASVGGSVAFAGQPALILAITPANRIGAANGLNSLARAIGMSAGSALFGMFAVLTATAVGGMSQTGIDAFTWVGAGVAAGAALALVAVRER